MYKILSNNVIIAKDFRTYNDAKAFVQQRRVNNCLILQQ